MAESLQQQWFPAALCLGCGPANEDGLGLESFSDGDDEPGYREHGDDGDERQGGARFTAPVYHAVLFMIGASRTWQMGAHFVVFGPAFGALLPLRAVVMGNWYSGPGYGQIMGMQWALASLAGAAGPAAVGVTRDATDGYGVPLTFIVAALVTAALLALVSGRAARSGKS